MSNLPYIPPFDAKSGWICPRCNGVMSPLIPMCMYCKPDGGCTGMYCKPLRDSG